MVRPRLGGRRGNDTPADLLVVGLGNPGPRYEGSRHNVGFDVIDVLAERLDVRLKPVKGVPTLAASGRMDDHRVVLAAPTTFMNESGQAVGALMRRHHVADPTHLVVVHDELDLAPGRLRVKQGGGLAGHNGLRSIVAHCHTDAFVRVRIGVGKPPDPTRGADHVLKRVPAAERRILDAVAACAADAIECIAADGATVAMERFNGVVVE